MASKSKRAHESDSDSSDDDDFGPTPVGGSESSFAAEASETTTLAPLKKRKVKKLEFEQVYIQNLPSAKMYEHSFMHRDVVTHIVISKPTEFVITASIDGHVKFWKKMVDSIEFVKHFQAHIAPITALELSADGRKLFTTSKDKMLKFFEVQSFDIASMISLNFTPAAGCWLPSELKISTQVAIADENSPIIFLFSAEGGLGPIAEVNVHSSPVR